MVRLKDINHGYVINLDNFFKNPISVDVKDGFIIAETVRVSLDDGRTVFNKNFYEIKDKKLVELTKKEATEMINTKLQEYLINNKILPPNVKLNKFLKNGKVKLSYDPEDYTKFSLTLPAKFADVESATELIMELVQNKEQNKDKITSDITDEYLSFVNEKTFYLNKLRGNLEEESLILKTTIKEYSDGNKESKKSYYLGMGEEDKKNLSLSKFTDILIEKIINYMKKYETWTPFTERNLKKEKKGDQISITYKPDKFTSFELEFPQKIEESLTEKFLSNLKQVEKAETSLFWKVENAKSARSTCKGCSEKIEKGELRIGKPSVFKEHVTHKWYHVDCARREELVMDVVKGLEELSEEDLEDLRMNNLIDEE